MKTIEIIGKEIVCEASHRFTSLLIKEKVYCELDGLRQAIRFDNIDIDMKTMCKNKLLFISGQTQFMKSRSPRAKNVQKNEHQLKRKVQTSSFKLTTPALIEAAEMGILNERNYNEIKNGGLTSIEKYASQSIGITKCYEAIKGLYEPKTIMIMERDPDSFKAEISEKIKKFNMDKKRYIEETTQLVYSYEPNSLRDELASPKTEEELTEKYGSKVLAQTELKTIADIFKD